MKQRRQRAYAAVFEVLLSVGTLIGITGCGGGQPSSVQPPAAISSSVSGQTEIKTAYFSDLHVNALVNGDGYALYIFAPDDHREVTCADTCALTWPPLMAARSDKQVIGPGVNKNMVGVEAGPQGSRVITYAGWPLYTYTADIQPGMASGQAINLNGGAWYLIQPDGKPFTSPGRSNVDGVQG